MHRLALLQTASRCFKRCARACAQFLSALPMQVPWREALRSLTGSQFGKKANPLTKQANTMDILFVFSSSTVRASVVSSYGMSEGF